MDTTETIAIYSLSVFGLLSVVAVLWGVVRISASLKRLRNGREDGLDSVEQTFNEDH